MMSELSLHIIIIVKSQSQREYTVFVSDNMEALVHNERDLLKFLLR